MIIQSGALQMSSTRKYTQTVTGLASVSTMADTSCNSSIFKLQGDSSKEQDFLGTLNYRMTPTKKAAETEETTETMQDKMLKMRFQTLHYLLEMLFKRRTLGDQNDHMSQQLNQILGNTSGSLTSGQGIDLYSYSSIEETETTTFSTTGTVKTSDGREISFDVNVGMSRSFYEENEMYLSTMSADLCDPLVINMDVPTAQVTDQKFYFDLDADGTKEYISTLGQGSGFLALDKNADGTINDGSELFGTQSGNGFYDLSQYDSDGNGWIDEADEIFDKLRIWTTDANGNSQLYTLKESGVGAICLCNVKTQFSLNDANNNTNGVIQQSGVFLKENGQASTIQHVDMAM